MVIDKLENLIKYSGLIPYINEAFRFLQQEDIARLEPGRYNIAGDEVYAISSKYRTIPIERGLWEAHRVYADIHYVAEGKEKLGFASVDTMHVIKEYDETKDCILFGGQGDLCTVNQGRFVFFMPENVHMPALDVIGTSWVTKIVIKIKF